SRTGQASFGALAVSSLTLTPVIFSKPVRGDDPFPHAAAGEEIGSLLPSSPIEFFDRGLINRDRV
ncbi:MAG: hypothetical protein ACI9B8_002763, partial [Sulfitobacter sp.]